MDAQTALATINRALKLAEDLAPLGVAIGLPFAAPAAAIISAAAEVSGIVGRAIEDGTLIATATDRNELAALTARLAEENDKLAAEIAAT